MASYHVAQYNIAKMRAELDDPVMQGFVSRLDELNHLADATLGCVWRHHTEDGTSTSIRAYKDKLVIINMSIWESIDALRAFTYRSDHGPMYAARHIWFEPMEGHTLVLWWVPAGAIPDASQGKVRLELLRRRGPSSQAFTMKERFPPPDE
ncbi:MAG: DUF3291 domain-containing protein [Dehalococcoidia bacterium]